MPIIQADIVPEITTINDFENALPGYVYNHIVLYSNNFFLKKIYHSVRSALNLILNLI